MRDSNGLCGQNRKTVNSHRHFLRLVGSATCAVVLVTGSLILTSPPLRATTTTPLDQLRSYLSAAIAQKNLPNVTQSIPTLSSLLTNKSSPIDLPPGEKFPMKPCYPYGDGTATVTVANVSTCSFGAKNATKTILLSGDSNAAMWIGPLAALGAAQGFRVIFFGQPGCPPWLVDGADNKVMYGTITVGSCVNLWNASIRAVSHEIKPNLVILTGMTGMTNAPNVFKTRLIAMVNGFKTASTRVLILGPFPHPSYVHLTPGACLTSGRPNSACVMSTAAVSNVFMTNGPQAATATKSTFVDVLSLFCVAQKCPMFVKTPTSNRLIYFDDSHMNRTYAAWIAPQLGQLLGTNLHF